MKKMGTAQTIFYVTLFVTLGAIATGVITLVFMVLTVMLTWIWYTFPRWAAVVLVLTFSGAIATEIYFAMSDVEKQMHVMCRRCRERRLPEVARW